MDNLENYISIQNENGEEELGYILFTYHSDEFNKDYVIFELGENVTAACYIPNEEVTYGEVFDIETDEEWNMISEVINSYYDDLESQEE